MRCPYCKGPVTELARECPSCRLEMSRVRALLGPVPIMQPGLSDHCGVLSSGEKKKIHKRLTRLGRRYPQLTFQILTHYFPAEHPFELYLFWIFNAGGVSSQNHKAGANRTVLLALDPAAGKSSLMVGYGLEPFVEDVRLDGILEDSRLPWSDGAWAEGILAALDGLDTTLELSLSLLGEAFDLTVHASQRQAGEF